MEKCQVGQAIKITHHSHSGILPIYSKDKNWTERRVTNVWHGIDKVGLTFIFKYVRFNNSLKTSPGRDCQIDPIREESGALKMLLSLISISHSSSNPGSSNLTRYEIVHHVFPLDGCGSNPKQWSNADSIQGYLWHFYVSNPSYLFRKFYRPVLFLMTSTYLQANSIFLILQCDEYSQQWKSHKGQVLLQPFWAKIWK